MKRNFAIDTTSIATAAPLLPDGTYAGTICNCSITMGQGDNMKHLITVKPEKKWDKNLGESIETGKHIVAGMFTFGATLISKKAASILQRDEPKVFGGQVFLNFDEEGVLKPNHVLGGFLKACGIDEINFSEIASGAWEYDENLEVPEDLQHIPDIINMLNSVNFYRIMFTEICNSANGQMVKVAVKTQPNYQDKNIKENVISRGTMSTPFCGILPYSEGCENDL